MASMASNGDENTSASLGGLASAIQTELKRRQDKSTKSAPTADGATATVAKVVKGHVAEKKAMLMQHQNDQHDQLMAEFRKVHRKLFSSSTEEEEEDTPSSSEPEACNKACSNEMTLSKKANINRSCDETLVKATKAPIVAPTAAAPPAPPVRTSSMESCHGNKVRPNYFHSFSLFKPN